MTDTRHLVDAARDGDETAIQRLIERHLPSLRAFVRLRSDSVVRAKESSSDVVQSVCREALENLDNFEWQGDASFRNWLYAWALNKIRNRLHYYKAQRRDAAREVPIAGPANETGLAELYDSIGSPSKHAMARERVKQIEAAFDQLSDDYREVLVKARLLGMSQAEICADMDKTPASVRSLLNRAAVRLAVLLDEKRPARD